MSISTSAGRWYNPTTFLMAEWLIAWRGEQGGGCSRPGNPRLPTAPAGTRQGAPACFCEEAAASCAERKVVGHCTSRMPRKSRPAASPKVLATTPPPTGITSVLREPPPCRNVLRMESSVSITFADSLTPIT